MTPGITNSNQALPTLVQWLAEGVLAPKHASVGFDGYVDAIYRPVKANDSAGNPIFFQTIEEYGRRIIRAANKSADIEIRMIDRRMGGNAPLLADGLAALDVETNLIGCMGTPELNSCFGNLPENVRTLSYGSPCETIALEFNDGKIMMGNVAGNDETDWQRMEAALGSDTLRDTMKGTSLVALLNWSIYMNMPDIARHVTELVGKHGPWIFFDLSDPSALAPEQMDRCLCAMAEMGTVLPTALGMNENEARIVIGHMFPELDKSLTLQELVAACGPELMKKLNLKTLTVHAVAFALGYDESGAWIADGFLVDRPKLSTGGGDHYNAAFCWGLVHGRPVPECLLLGSAASSFYVKNGVSATREDLKKCVQNRKEQNP